MIRRYKILSAILMMGMAAILTSAKIIQSDTPPTVDIELERQNVFYQGVDNPVALSSRGVAPEDLIVTLDRGTISPVGKNGKYNVRVDSVHAYTPVFLTLKMKQGNDTVALGTYKYRIKRVPDPVTYVGSIRSEGVMLKNNLQTVSGVFTRMENFDFDCTFKLQSFSMSVFHDSAWKEYKTAGPSLNAEMKAALNKAMPEDKVLFHNVVTKGPDSTLRKVNVVMITVK